MANKQKTKEERKKEVLASRNSSQGSVGSLYTEELSINFNSIEYEEQEQFDGEQPNNPALIKKNKVFGIVMVITQLAIAITYGFLIEIPQRTETSIIRFQQFQFFPILITFGLYLLVLAGFGAFYAFNRQLAFSGIGFNLLITCMTIQWYFLINAFWTKVNIGNQGTQFTFATRIWEIYLDNFQSFYEVPDGSEILIQRYRGTLIEALKCAIANSVIFSAILGRAGPIQAYFVALIGTFGYELNRYVLTTIGNDFGYSSQIFLYGGTAACFAGLFLSRKEKETTQLHFLNTGSSITGTISIFGAIIIWIFLPLLVLDPELKFIRTHPSAITIIPISIYYSVSASIISSIAFCIFFNNKLLMRNIILAIVGGGIASSSASYYILNPVYSLIIGFTSGLIQNIICLVEKKKSRSKVISTFSFATFVFHGFAGCVWDSIFRAAVSGQQYRQGFTYDDQLLNLPVMGFAMGLISIFVGFLAGLIIGIISMILTKQQKLDQFNDFAYWAKDDGISYDLPFDDESGRSSQMEFHIRQNEENLKGRNSYL